MRGAETPTAPLRQRRAWEVLPQPQLNQPHFRKPAKIYKPRGRTITLCKSWQSTDLIMRSPIRDEETLSVKQAELVPSPQDLLAQDNVDTCTAAWMRHPHRIIGHKEEHTLLSCVSHSHVALIWKLNWNQVSHTPFHLPKGPGIPFTLTGAGSSHTSSPQLSPQLPALCNPAATRNPSVPMPEKDATRKAGRNNQGDSEGQAVCDQQEQRGLWLPGDPVFLLSSIFWLIFPAWPRAAWGSDTHPADTNTASLALQARN